jgi:hypothetical protein
MRKRNRVGGIFVSMADGVPLGHVPNLEEAGRVKYGNAALRIAEGDQRDPLCIGSSVSARLAGQL